MHLDICGVQFMVALLPVQMLQPMLPYGMLIMTILRVLLISRHLEGGRHQLSNNMRVLHHCVEPVLIEIGILDLHKKNICN